MIRDIVRQAWADSPALVILTVPAAVLVVLGAWVGTVAFLVGFGA